MRKFSSKFISCCCTSVLTTLYVVDRLTMWKCRKAMWQKLDKALKLSNFLGYYTMVKIVYKHTEKFRLYPGQTPSMAREQRSQTPAYKYKQRRTFRHFYLYISYRYWLVIIWPITHSPWQAYIHLSKGHKLFTKNSCVASCNNLFTWHFVKGLQKLLENSHATFFFSKDTGITERSIFW